MSWFQYRFYTSGPRGRRHPGVFTDSRLGGGACRTRFKTFDRLLSDVDILHQAENISKANSPWCMSHLKTQHLEKKLGSLILRFALIRLSMSTPIWRRPQGAAVLAANFRFRTKQRGLPYPSHVSYCINPSARTLVGNI